MSVNDEEIVKLLKDSGIEAEAADGKDEFDKLFRSVAEIPPFVPEEEDPNVLIKGRWLERGGSAFWVSTAGTGKSIACMQAALSWAAGLPFAGLVPNCGPMKVWLLQTEDSDTRLAIDRDDVTAELEEQHPHVNWREKWERVKLLDCVGNCGVSLISWLDETLAEAGRRAQLPDVVILNPFLAFVGGPVTDSTFVTPFLRGGVIGREETKGLQAVISRHRVGLLAFHHTPKPPSEKELSAWMKSAFPEYQGAGSSEITNWGRSFLTMMKVPNHPRTVCLTAGKNGGELGWETIDGATRRYLSYSDGVGVTGRGRHAWRELTDEEMEEFVKPAEDKIATDAETIAAELRRHPSCRARMMDAGRCGLSHGRFRAAWAKISACPSEFFLVSAKGKDNSTWLGSTFSAIKNEAVVTVVTGSDAVVTHHPLLGGDDSDAPLKGASPCRPKMPAQIGSDGDEEFCP